MGEKIHFSLKKKGFLKLLYQYLKKYFEWLFFSCFYTYIIQQQRYELNEMKIKK